MSEVSNHRASEVYQAMSANLTFNEPFTPISSPRK